MHNYWVPAVYWVFGKLYKWFPSSELWPPGQGLGNGSVVKGRECAFTTGLVCELSFSYLYFLSTNKHAWWDNVSVMSVHFPKAFGCSCDWLNMSPCKSFTVGNVLFSGSIFSVSGCQKFIVIMEMHKQINILKMCFYTEHCGDSHKKRLRQGP